MEITNEHTNRLLRYSKTVWDPFDVFMVKSDSFLLISVMMKVIMVPIVSGRNVTPPTNLMIM
jgi:hypothetical protein